ncbi:MAG: N-acetylmuramoyl-L-alanine amidase [Alistipes sp.]|nr:N-acetylmuramoyl-L-alanine amidase [Alistipes sp.]
MRARNILTLLVLFLTLALPSEVYAATEHGVRVVVLDAGHGGNDPGAVYGGVKEKDLTLKVVLRLGKKIEQGMPGVKVVYTRTTDKALAPTKIEDLQKRADIANKAEGDLFLSVHVNAARSTSAKGVETLIMGETPKEQQYNTNALFESNRDDLLDMSNEKEAAIIRAYIQNLQFTYGEYSMTMARCVQQNYMQAGCYSRGVKQQPLRVLYATNMPGVLTEIGFLSNKEDFAFLKSDKGLTSIVNALYQAVQDYSAYVLKTRLAVDDMAEVKPTPAPKVEAKPESKPEVKPQPEAKPEVKAPETPKADEPKLYDARLYGGQQPQRTAQKTAEAATQSKPSATSSVEKSSAQQPAVEATPQRYYTVQVMASKRVQPLASQEFKSYRNRVHQYQSEGEYRYKYGVGQYATRAEAIKAAEAVRKTFPQAFVVAVENGVAVTSKK